MSSSGLSSIGTGAGSAAALADATANPTTGLTGALAQSYNGASWDRTRTPTVFKQAAVLAVGNQPLWTPAAGKKFRLMRYMLMASADTALAAAGRNLIQLFDGAAAIGIAVEPWMPAAGLNNGGLLFSTGWVDLGNGILSAAANNVLNFNIGTGLTGGVIRALTAGVEE